MSNLIDRQAAIDGADAIITRDTSGNNDVVKAMTAWKRYVEALPTVEGRKKGKWIGLDDDAVMTDTVQCSVCRKQFTVDADRFYDIGFVIEDLQFCPNCGADMRGETDG